MGRPSIEHRFLGGTERIDFAQFASAVVQEHDLAREVAATMFRTDLPYKWNEDQAEFYAEFEVVDADALREQLAEQSYFFSRLRLAINEAIAAAAAGFQSESDDDEPPEFWSDAREFESAARTLRSLRAALS